MLTHCPNCETIYRLGVADLGAAQGFVECGCGAEFNAIGRLADEPKFLDEASAPSTDLGAVSAELEQASLFETPPETPPEQDSESDIAPDTATAIADDAEPEWGSIDMAAQEPVNDMVSAVEEPEPAIVDLAEPPSSTLSESKHAILFTDPSDEFEDDDAADLGQIDIDEIPAILQDEVAALKRQPKRGLRWL